MWGSLWVHLVLMSLWIYWISLEKNLDICFHHKAREVFNHYLFKEDFHSFLSSPPGAPECSCHCLTVPEVPHKGCHCFVTGFLLLPDWVISTACLLDCWPSLLYPQICCWFHPVYFFFFIYLISFFNCNWFSFIYSISLLNFSLSSSILLWGLVTLFMSNVSNSFFGSLLIFFLFSYFSEIWSYSFIWNMSPLLILLNSLCLCLWIR